VFLFSLTSKVKCLVSNPATAAYGTSTHGPVFGEGRDLSITFGRQQQFIKAHTYLNADKLIPIGMAHMNSQFTVLEIEVFVLS